MMRLPNLSDGVSRTPLSGRYLKHQGIAPSLQSLSGITGYYVAGYIKTVCSGPCSNSKQCDIGCTCSNGKCLQMVE
jgi:hypothetical protein